jgi:radical SAM protein with 4Fe4S-binding SPASM domain
MSVDEFLRLMPKLRPYTDYLYFHLMGEPLCHPDLEDFLKIAGEFGFRVILTTNGTLLSAKEDMLANASALHKVNISLHAFEANDYQVPFDTYLSRCFQFGQTMGGQKIVVYRLWNNGGLDSQNEHILTKLKEFFPGEWVRERNGIRIADKTYLEHGDRFDWPDLSCDASDQPLFCYGLRDQIGILCDGTVVPCCLDHEGDIALGNLYADELDDILTSQRAQAIYNGFTHKNATEELCRRCGYARRF